MSDLSVSVRRFSLSGFVLRGAMRRKLDALGASTTNPTKWTASPASE